MSSSGVFVGSYNDVRCCRVESVDGVDCDFEGEVEVWFDTETGSQWWGCDLCGYEHDEEFWGASTTWPDKDGMTLRSRGERTSNVRD